jgi:hypothetical protein
MSRCLRARTRLRLTVVLLFLLAAVSFAAKLSFFSNVSLQSANANKSTGELEGKVGYHFSARVNYQIGLFQEGQTGSIEISKSYVVDPEYQMFVDTGEHLPPGLSFDTETGMLSGEPTALGKWQVYPAVRCKVRGDNVYRGHGFWFTSYNNYKGQVWTEAKNPAVISISE